MQEKYIGDPGDFAKFLLLKGLCAANKTLGINWYLVSDDKSSDGNKKLGESLVDVDKDLFDKLRLLKLNQNIKEVEAANLFLCKTKYYHDVMNHKVRNDWFDRSIVALKECDIIFCDPDNGMEIPSCKINSPKSIKFTTFDEIKHYFNGGSSVVVYQHGNRSGLAKQESDRKKQLAEKLEISTNDIEALYSSNGGSRFFFVIMQPKYKNELLDRIKSLPTFFTQK